jgi:hypothetical protein
VTFGEEPFESSQSARERLPFDQQQRLVGEGCGVGDGKLASARDESEEDFDVAREPVGGVEARRGDGV